MIPQHVALIMDGNGRWAKAKGKPRTYGHKVGSETLKQICKDAYNIGIKYITVYAFSTENWKRSTDEVSFLMNLLRQFLKESIKTAKENNMRVRVIGRRLDLDKDIVEAIEKLEEATRDLDGLQLQIAINYGGRDEVIRGVKNIVEYVLKGENTSETMEHRFEYVLNELDEEKFAYYLDTINIPDPELLIRTSGEMRTSNFLLWQCAYSEFYVTDKCWPDFDRNELVKAIDAFSKRDRRYGGVKDED